MVDSATPETGTEPVALPQPELTPDERALAIIDGQIEPQGDQEPVDEPPKVTVKDDEPRALEESEEPEPEVKAEEPEPEEEPASEKDDEQEELPASLAELAEAFEMEQGALSDHLKVQVKVDGEVSEVTLGEALKGYSRESDYTQRTMRHAEEVNAFKAQASEADAQWQQKLTIVDDMISALAETLPNVDEEALISRYTDEDGDFNNAGYLREKAEIARVYGNMEGVYGQRQAQRETAQAEQAEHNRVYRAEQQQQLAAVAPEFSDPEKVRAFETKAGSLLTEVGYTPEEIGHYFSGGFDHRQVLVLQKALSLDTLEKSKPARIKKLKELPKVQRPGVAAEKDGDRGDRVTAAKQRLKRASTRKGRDDAALELISDRFLGGKQ